MLMLMLFVKNLACVSRTRKILRTRSAGCWAEKKAQKIFPDMKSWSESEGRKRRMMEDSDNNLTIYYKGGFHSHQNDIIEKQRNISINSHKTQLTKSPPPKKNKKNPSKSHQPKSPEAFAEVEPNSTKEELKEHLRFLDIQHINIHRNNLDNNLYNILDNYLDNT